MEISSSKEKHFFINSFSEEKTDLYAQPLVDSRESTQGDAINAPTTEGVSITAHPLLCTRESNHNGEIPRKLPFVISAADGKTHLVCLFVYLCVFYLFYGEAAGHDILNWDYIAIGNSEKGHRNIPRLATKRPLKPCWGCALLSGVLKMCWNKAWERGAVHRAALLGGDGSIWEVNVTCQPRAAPGTSPQPHVRWLCSLLCCCSFLGWVLCYRRIEALIILDPKRDQSFIWYQWWDSSHQDVAVYKVSKAKLSSVRSLYNQNK